MEFPAVKPSRLPRHGSLKHFWRNSSNSGGKSEMISESNRSAGGGGVETGGVGVGAGGRLPDGGVSERKLPVSISLFETCSLVRSTIQSDSLGIFRKTHSIVALSDATEKGANDISVSTRNIGCGFVSP
jgi:hypothetical protein